MAGKKRCGLEDAFRPNKENTVFQKVLVANRGEIALRIIRSCKELGIRSAAVFTDDDKNPLITCADRCVKLKGDNMRSTYLNIDQLIRVAKSERVDAIHPGYGFLSENANFAKACEDAGIRFIGPSSAVLRVVSDKAKCKELARDEGLPVLPDSGCLSTKDALLAYAKKNGYPLLLKSRSGGGGKGMRKIESENDLLECFSSARRELSSGFSSPQLFLEKCVSGRHIEFQILADDDGNVVHLGERECSIQRRYQKLIEESPSALLDGKMRAKMGRLACRFTKRIGFSGACTVEFLVKGNRFYFLEINPRIQVEHGVTELVTGIDIVKEQLAIAQGRTLPYQQADISLKGHAIECRIVAECARNGFSPDQGVLRKVSFPDTVVDDALLRIDSAAYPGMRIDVYDSLIAKLISWAPTRESAICAMQDALHNTCIAGIANTTSFYKFLLRDSAFIKGDISTTFISDRNIVPKFTRSTLSPEKIALIAAMIYDKERKHTFSKVLTRKWTKLFRKQAVEQNS